MQVRGEPIHARLILECGQTFRYEKRDEGCYFGIVGNRGIYVEDVEEGIDIYPVYNEEQKNFWNNYFDLRLDYLQLLRKLTAKDIVLANAVKEFLGIRLLNQPLFETLISFIISANNNIMRIKGIIERLCALAGEKVEMGGQEFYAFPQPENIASLKEEQLRAIGAGYRAPYLLQTSRMILEGFALEELKRQPYAEAKEKLCLLSGVGPKVADCVLLFSCGKKEAFPVDTWMKKVLLRLYGVRYESQRQIENFARQHFKGYAGIAQQYLFHYARMHKLI